MSITDVIGEVMGRGNYWGQVSEARGAANHPIVDVGEKFISTEDTTLAQNKALGPRAIGRLDMGGLKGINHHRAEGGTMIPQGTSLAIG